METTVLFPGVTLCAVEETRFKSEYLSVSFICSGDLYDRACTAVLPAVLLRGCRAYPDEAKLDAALLDLYDADLSCSGFGVGESYVLRFRLNVHDAAFLPDGESIRRSARDLFFSFIFDVLKEKDGFSTRYVRSEKKNLLDRLRAEKVNKAHYAVGKCMRMLCRGEPIDYSTADLRRDLKSVNAAGLYDYYTRILRDAQVVVFYVGAEDRAQLRRDLSSRLTPLHSPKQTTAQDIKSPKKPKTERKTERADAHQSTLCVGYKTDVEGERALAAQALMREMLCNSPTSLIFENLREKQSLCYYCADRMLARKGVYMLYAGIDGKNARKVEETLDAQIETLASGAFDEERLEKSKRALLNVLKQARDHPSDLESFFVRRTIMGACADRDAYRDALSALTKEDVVRAASSLKKDVVFLLYGKKSERRPT